MRRWRHVLPWSVASAQCSKGRQCLAQADKQPDFMQARVTEGLLAVPAFQQRLWVAAHPGVQQPLGAVPRIPCGTLSPASQAHTCTGMRVPPVDMCRCF